MTALCACGRSNIGEVTASSTSVLSRHRPTPTAELAFPPMAEGWPLAIKPNLPVAPTSCYGIWKPGEKTESSGMDLPLVDADALCFSGLPLSNDQVAVLEEWIAR